VIMIVMMMNDATGSDLNRGDNRKREGQKRERQSENDERRTSDPFLSSKKKTTSRGGDFDDAFVAKGRSIGTLLVSEIKF